MTEDREGFRGDPADRVEWDTRYTERERLWSGQPNGALVVEPASDIDGACSGQKGGAANAIDGAGGGGGGSMGGPGRSSFGNRESESHCIAPCVFDGRELT